MSTLGTSMRRLLMEKAPADDILPAAAVAAPSKSLRVKVSTSVPAGRTIKVTYPPILHENLDIPYGQRAKKVAKPYFSLDTATIEEVIDSVSRASLIGTSIVISLPTDGATSVDVPTRQIKIKSKRRLNFIVVWSNACLSWHSPNGEYLVTENGFPNFVANSGAQLWLSADGLFRDRGDGVANYINSCGFSMILLPEGSLKHLSVKDINGNDINVNEEGEISEVYLPRPLHAPANAWRPGDLDLQYLIFDEELGRLLATAIVGPLSHPVFQSNGTLPNLVTIGTLLENAVDDGGDTSSITVHHVEGFPYVPFGDWEYVGMKDLHGPSMITMSFVEGAADGSDPVYRYAYALEGKLVKTDLGNPIWSPECSKYAIIQVGPTCASTAILNLILCCAPLRNYCVKVINGYLASQEDFQRLATLSRWKADILHGENLMETLLHTVYKRLCGATVGTPEVLLLSGICLYAQTYESARYKQQADDIKGYHMLGQLVVEFLRSLGLHSGLLHAPDDRMIPAKYDYLLRFGSRKKLAPLSLGEFVLVGCIIGTLFKTVREDGSSEIGAHGIVGVICETGERILFDSNFGEFKCDWLDKRAVDQNVKETYNATDILRMHQILLYMSTAFMDAHGHHDVPCLSTAAEDMVNHMPSELYSSDDLTSLARMMYPTHFGKEKKPYSIATGELESNSGNWLKRP